ncbi:conserved hypothetical protein [Aeromonas veronii]|uniref:Uncharacterized protein n=1 Tax=Aeromonas veronii TaxID=654 RepID=A0A653LDG4_AERVE|nr:conserved hypothetical protein [Aeromonas veronii]
MAETAQLGLCHRPAGAGALLVVAQERLGGASHLPAAGLRPALAETGEAAAPHAGTLECKRGLIGLLLFDLASVGIDDEMHLLILAIEGFDLEFVPFQLHFPNVVIPLRQQEFDQPGHVETVLGRPACGTQQAKDQQETARDHIHSGFMAGRL